MTSINLKQMRPLYAIRRQESGRDFPGGPTAKTLCFHCRGMGSVPGGGLRSCTLYSAAVNKQKIQRTS